MGIFEAFFLGIIQGLTEFIPISSSGHLYIIPAVLGMSVPTTEFILAIQVGTLLALIIYFRKKLYQYTRSLVLFVLRRKIKFKDRQNLNIVRNVILASFPGAVIGILVNSTLEEYYDQQIYASNTMFLVIAIPMFLIGMLFVFEKRFFKKNRAEASELKPFGALIVGLFQTLAFIRGISRSGITLLSGQLVGMKRVDAAEFSFLMSIPIIGASSLVGVYRIIQNTSSIDVTNMVVGILGAFIAGYWAIDFMLTFLKNQGLKIFGIYRIIFAILLILIFLL